MRVLSHVALSAALTLAAFSPAAGQGAPNLTGTWVMVADKSNFGTMPAPQSRTDVIDHKDPSLVIKRTQTGGPMGDVTATLTYGIDGKSYKNTLGPNDVTSTLKWDGQVLVVESTVSTPNGDATVTDRFSLSADKKMLTQDRKISIQGQELAQTIVLAKQ